MRTYIFFLFSLIFLSTSVYAQEIMKIVNPQPLSLNDEDIASFVIEANSENIDFIEIENDSKHTVKLKVNSKRTHYCETIYLSLGENTIVVKGYKEDTLVVKKIRKIYFTSKVDKEYRYPPKEYNLKYFHQDINENICKKCHDMSVNEVENVAFENIKESNCYQCHNKITSKKNGHAPSVNWLCTSCHNGEVGKFNLDEENVTKYTVPDPIDAVCFKCHKDNDKTWTKKRFQHEPADSGRCNKCHNPHSSKHESFLRKSVWELCTGCHKDKVEGMHIVKTFSRVSHPTRGVKDPSRKGEDLNCISCHNPHTSNAPFLLQSETSRGLCSRCHKK